MKRILSACVEQTQKFETEDDFQTYCRGLDRKRVKYKIVEKAQAGDGCVLVKIIRDYNSYSTGDYLD